jgi:hypothetical protein
MPIRLVQYIAADGSRAVAALGDSGVAHRIAGAATTYELARRALRERASLAALAASQRSAEAVDVSALLAARRVLAPIDHPDDAHVHLTGTGLTHLGSADGRDKMHKAAAGGAATDSMRMFLMGLEGGKPKDGGAGVQPEWFYKGDGSSIVAPGAPLPSPEFALDGGEEPEIAGVYLIDDAGAPRRLGYCLANEFSDHITERTNYLWLAHSKLRPAALGGELLVGELPADVRGVSRIVRDGATLWEKPFYTGEANMSHALGNLEHHHFKYALFRRPHDVHVHFFGAATLSFAEGVRTRAGDVFEIEAPPFLLPLRNTLASARGETVVVRAL